MFTDMFEKMMCKKPNVECVLHYFAFSKSVRLLEYNLKNDWLRNSYP